MNNNKIVPSIWFSAEGGKISGVIEYYKKVFGKELEAGQIKVMEGTPSGHTEICDLKIFGQAYIVMCTEQEHHKFNDAIAFTINCDDQKEIDKYWDYFIKEGSEVQCGWCVDKYGLRWQVLPKNFGELMSRPNAWQVMMKQKKIVIAEY